MKEDEKMYIKAIVNQVLKDLEYDKRMRKLETKVFNGFNTKINALFCLYSIFLGVLIKLAFF